jgi:phenylacetate-CoA ligase
MSQLGLLGSSYFVLKTLSGSNVYRYYSAWSKEDCRSGIAGSVIEASLLRLLKHCYEYVPYYRQLFDQRGITPRELDHDPLAALHSLPLLTKDTIRTQADALTSKDIHTRRWFYNTSGGSTGEPVRFIQDAEYADKSLALTMLYSQRIGKLPGESELRVWGSERDIFAGTVSLRARLVNALTHTRYINAFRMTPESMKESIRQINVQRPKLIVAYAQAMYELAAFAEREGIRVMPQNAIITSAGTLYDFMRSRIESVFGCPVYNRYGSREVGNIACERPKAAGLFSLPWGTYIEIVDDKGHPVPPGTEGEIIITSLINFAMPLLRYRIGDRGSFLEPSPHSDTGQVLGRISGRVVDSFIAQDGTIVDGEYFTHLMYFRPWVLKFQVVQQSVNKVTFFVVPGDIPVSKTEIEEITAKTRLVLGEAVDVSFEFSDDIAAGPSGKYRYTISEVAR